MSQLSRKKIFLPFVPKPQLDISRRVLRGPDGKSLHVLGAFNAPMSIDSRFDRSSRHTVYVIRGLHVHVFTRTSSDSSTSRSTTSSSRQPLSYDDRQSWLQEQCNLGLSPTLHWSRGNARNAAPYSLSRQCYTLLAQYAMSGTCPLIAKVDATLGKMESQGVIRRIDEPTEWCAGMVVVPKSNVMFASVEISRS